MLQKCQMGLIVQRGSKAACVSSPPPSSPGDTHLWGAGRAAASHPSLLILPPLPPAPPVLHTARRIFLQDACSTLTVGLLRLPSVVPQGPSSRNSNRFVSKPCMICSCSSVWLRPLPHAHHLSWKARPDYLRLPDVQHCFFFPCLRLALSSLLP